jgi:HEAT repeat protein
VLLFLPDPSSNSQAREDPRYLEVAELGHQRDPANLSALRDAATDPHPRVRQAAIVWLARYHRESEVPFLIHVMRTDVSPRVRAAAAQALGKFRKPEVGDALLAALCDEAEIVRLRAGVSMTRLVGVDVRYRAWEPTEKRQRAIRKLRMLWDGLRQRTEERRT